MSDSVTILWGVAVGVTEGVSVGIFVGARVGVLVVVDVLTGVTKRFAGKHPLKLRRARINKEYHFFILPSFGSGLNIYSNWSISLQPKLIYFGLS